jgi:molecular chaperone GrpE
MTRGKRVKSEVELEDLVSELDSAEEEPVAEGQPEDEFEKVSRERDEYLDLLTRKQAEFENFRRRVEKEKADIRVLAQSEVIREVLAVVDACETGLVSLCEADSADSEVFLEGYELLLKQLKSLLDKFEVTEVPAVGKLFDPNVHEAVVREVSPDHEEGEVLEQYRKGYLIRDRLLRPSQVRVAVQPEE